MQHDLQIFLDGISESIASEYKRIYRRSTEDPGTAGDQGEENWADIIRQWLPPYYRVVTKGRIINAEGETSPQIDVIVLQPEYPRALISKKLYLSDGVAAAFECKNTLTTADLRDTFANARAVKRLYAPRYGSVQAELHSPIVYGLLAHSHKWRSGPSSVKSLIGRHLTAEGSKVDHVRELLDFVCVANLAFWNTAQFLSASRARPEDDPKTEGWVCYLCHDRPGENFQLGPHDETFSACGPFITALLRRMANENVNLVPLSRYFNAIAPRWGLGDFPRVNIDSFSHLSQYRQTAVMDCLEQGDGSWDDFLY